jgi:hypothetical protein
MTQIDIFRDTAYGGRVDPAEQKRRDKQLANDTRLDVKHELQKLDLEGYPNMIQNPKAPWVHREHKDHNKKWPGTYHVSVKNGKPMVELRFHKDQRESKTALRAVDLLKKKFDVSVVDTPPKTEW